jgi:hypothetical protein
MRRRARAADNNNDNNNNNNEDDDSASRAMTVDLDSIDGFELSGLADDERLADNLSGERLGRRRRSRRRRGNDVAVLGRRMQRQHLEQRDPLSLMLDDELGGESFFFSFFFLRLR